MRLLKIILGATMLIGLGACEKYEIDKESQEGFKGDLIVSNPDGTTFTNKDTRILISKSLSDVGKYDIFIKKVKFAEKMPVRIDMTIPSVSIENNIISGQNIIPWAMGGPYEKWTITEISGRVTLDDDGKYKTLSIDMICDNKPVTYRGEYIDE